MIVSAFRTKLTRMIQDGEKNPERDPVNKKTIQKVWRRERWIANGSIPRAKK